MLAVIRIALYNVGQEKWTAVAPKGTMEPEDDLSTGDPQDLMSSRGLLPSASTSLLSCTFLVYSSTYQFACNTVP